jgi:hypothetical protein
MWLVGGADVGWREVCTHWVHLACCTMESLRLMSRRRFCRGSACGLFLRNSNTNVGSAGVSIHETDTDLYAVTAICADLAIRDGSLFLF